MAEMQRLGVAIERVRASWVEKGKMLDVRGTDDDLRPEPIDGGPWCDTCRGARFLRRDVDRDDPDFGKGVPCQDCLSVVIQRRLERMGDEVPPLFRKLTLESLIEREPGHAQLVERLRAWVDGRLITADDPIQPWLYLWGRAGRGKTGLAVALLRECIERGHSGAFRVVSDMLQSFRDSYRSLDTLRDDEHGIAKLAVLRAVDVLVLDDVGAQRVTDWVGETLLQIIGYRHDYKKRTILTGNIDLEALADHFGNPRVASRIQEMTDGDRWEIEVVGPNLRKREEAF